MKKEFNTKKFFDTSNRIQSHQFQLTNEIDKNFKDLKAKREKFDIDGFVWSSIGLDLYLIGRYEDSIEAYQIAIETAKEWWGKEDDSLISMYGDLAMVYEANRQYKNAMEMSKNAFNLYRIHKGTNHIFSRVAYEDLRRLKHFAKFIPNNKLNDELLAFKGDKQDIVFSNVKPSFIKRLAYKVLKK